MSSLAGGHDAGAEETGTAAATPGGRLVLGYCVSAHLMEEKE